MRILLLSCLFLLGCASTGTGLNMYSIDQEKQIGDQYSQEVAKEYKMLRDSWLDAYVTRLGNKMLAASPVPPAYDFTFQVIKDEQINAFAIPGGHVYINLGLLRSAESEAELVGVVGHEIGHVVHRHGTQRMTDANIVYAAALGTAIATEKNSGHENAQLAGTGVMLLGQGGLLHYGRNAELESDRTAIQILSNSNYDIYAMENFFKKLKVIEEKSGKSGGPLAAMLSTHPSTSVRINQCQSITQTMPKQESPNASSDDFNEMKRRIERIR